MTILTVLYILWNTSIVFSRCLLSNRVPSLNLRLFPFGLAHYFGPVVSGPVILLTVPALSVGS
jgi:hypothetical protein